METGETNRNQVSVAGSSKGGKIIWKLKGKVRKGSKERMEMRQRLWGVFIIVLSIEDTEKRRKRKWRIVHSIYNGGLK